MRILLAANASYEPPRGGSTRSNLAWLRQLAARGHACRVVSLEEGAEASTVAVDGVVIQRVPQLARQASALRAAIAEWQPDWVLISSEDLTHRLLREASAAAPSRVIYLAHTPQFFPFGPESWHRDPSAAELLRRARAVITISQSVDAYVRAHLGVETTVLHPPVYGPEPYANLSCFERRTPLLINPCAVKGLPIFLELARRLPAVRFLALAGWGTGRRDREQLAALPNVELIEPVPQIEEALARASLVLMPSLWMEGFGLAATEAMLRGLPVLAADYGGLREALDGTGGLLPVAPITGYEAEFDDRLLPRAIVPPQDCGPWERALRELLEDPDRYERAAAACRECALQTVRRVSPEGLEGVLRALPPVDPLAEARQRLLARRIAERRQRFPGSAEGRG